MTKVPFVDLSRQHNEIRDELMACLTRVLDTNAYILGRETKDFEAQFAEFVGAKHAIACANGTDGLVLSLLAHGVGVGDEVITVSNTFFATVEAIVSVGAIPVLVDVKEEDGLINPELLSDAITKRTKAIIPVHLYGQPVDLEAVNSIASNAGIAVIEDAAQAHGALYQGKPIGSISSLTSFSFYPGKNLGALGDAGAITTNSDELATKLRSLRDHGRTEKYSHHEFGWNMRVDGLQSAFLAVKLKRLAKWNEDRSKVASIYHRELVGLSGINLLKTNPDVKHAHHLFVVLSENREVLQAELKKRGIEAGVHYPLGCHQQPAWSTRFESCSLPVTEKFTAQCLSLPIFGGMTEQEANCVVETVKEILG
jgi:dTDP-4-amino-4,6-dideoxygalactose transaminase